MFELLVKVQIVDCATDAETDESLLPDGIPDDEYIFVVSSSSDSSVLLYGPGISGRWMLPSDMRKHLLKALGDVQCEPEEITHGQNAAMIALLASADVDAKKLGVLLGELGKNGYRI